MFGLNEKELHTLRSILQSHGISSAKIFGSRAKGTHKKEVTSTLPSLVMKKLAYILNEESPLIYQCDVVNLSKLTNQSLIDHIQRVGKSLF